MQDQEQMQERMLQRFQFFNDLQITTYKGAGTEIMNNYPNCKLTFEDIGNIHVMRDSLSKFREAISLNEADVCFNFGCLLKLFRVTISNGGLLLSRADGSPMLGEF